MSQRPLPGSCAPVEPEAEHRDDCKRQQHKDEYALGADARSISSYPREATEPQAPVGLRNRLLHVLVIDAGCQMPSAVVLPEVPPKEPLTRERRRKGIRMEASYSCAPVV